MGVIQIPIWRCSVYDIQCQRIKTEYSEYAVWLYYIRQRNETVGYDTGS